MQKHIRSSSASKNIVPLNITLLALHEKSSCLEFFWFVFPHIRTEYGELQYLSVFSPNARIYGPEKPEYGYFSCSVN